MTKQYLRGRDNPVFCGGEVLLYFSFLWGGEVGFGLINIIFRRRPKYSYKWVASGFAFLACVPTKENVGDRLVWMNFVAYLVTWPKTETSRLMSLPPKKWKAYMKANWKNSPLLFRSLKSYMTESGLPNRYEKSHVSIPLSNYSQLTEWTGAATDKKYHLFLL